MIVLFNSPLEKADLLALCYLVALLTNPVRELQSLPRNRKTYNVTLLLNCAGLLNFI